MSTIKSAVDSVYAYKFVRLMQKSFEQWSAYEHGIIDAKGSVLKRPKSDLEKSAYTPFHAAVRSMKRMMTSVPGLAGVSSMMSAWSAVASRYSINESVLKELPLLEAMVAGDAPGEGQAKADNIAKGVTTGDVVNAGPGVIGKRKRLKVDHSKL